MRISYNKLWKMLIDKNMKKSDLKEKAGISLLPLRSSARETTLPQMFCFVFARQWIVGLKIFSKRFVTNQH